jgi:hypothetical protein
MIGLEAVAALLAGAGVWLIVLGLTARLRRPSLAAYLDGRRRRLAAAPTPGPTWRYGAPALDATVTPLVRRAARALARRLEGVGIGRQARLAERLAMVQGATPADHWAARIGWGLAGAAAGAALSAVPTLVGGAGVDLLAPALLAIVGAVFPDWRLAWQVRQYREQVAVEVGPLLNRLTIALRAGLDVQPALTRAIRGRDDPLATELGEMLDRHRFGQDLFAQIVTLGKRLGLPALEDVATTLILTDLYGVDVCDQLTAIAADLADEEFERFERDGRRAAVAMVAPLGLFFLPAFMLVILVPAGVRFFAVLGQ